MGFCCTLLACAKLGGKRERDGKSEAGVTAAFPSQYAPGGASWEALAADYAISLLAATKSTSLAAINVPSSESSMTKPAVEFDVSDNELYLIYRPRDDTSWVREKFERGDGLKVKGTFHLTSQDLVGDATEEAGSAATDDEILWADDDRLVFAIATADGEYFRFKPEVLGFDTPVLLHREARPNWKWFIAERKVSILGVVESLGLDRIVIGGPDPDAIPIPEYERLLNQFPTPHELRRYVQARVGSVVRQYAEPAIDAEALLNAYVNKRTTATAPNLEASFRQFDVAKYAFALERAAGHAGQRGRSLRGAVAVGDRGDHPATKPQVHQGVHRGQALGRRRLNLAAHRHPLGRCVRQRRRH